MAVNTPHLRFPLSLDSTGHLNTVEQDSDDDILGCVYLALLTPLGSRPFVPNFGVDDFTFATGNVQLSEIQHQILASEPRADVSLSEEIEELVQKVVVGVGNVG